MKSVVIWSYVFDTLTDDINCVFCQPDSVFPIKDEATANTHAKIIIPIAVTYSIWSDVAGVFIQGGTTKASFKYFDQI